MPFIRSQSLDNHHSVASSTLLYYPSSALVDNNDYLACSSLAVRTAVTSIKQCQGTPCPTIQLHPPQSEVLPPSSSPIHKTKSLRADCLSKSRVSEQLLVYPLRARFPSFSLEQRRLRCNQSWRTKLPDSPVPQSSPTTHSRRIPQQQHLNPHTDLLPFTYQQA